MPKQKAVFLFESLKDFRYSSLLFSLDMSLIHRSLNLAGPPPPTYVTLYAPHNRGRLAQPIFLPEFACSNQPSEQPSDLSRKSTQVLKTCLPPCPSLSQCSSSSMRQLSPTTVHPVNSCNSLFSLRTWCGCWSVVHPCGPPDVDVQLNSSKFGHVSALLATSTSVHILSKTVLESVTMHLGTLVTARFGVLVSKCP